MANPYGTVNKEFQKDMAVNRSKNRTQNDYMGTRKLMNDNSSTVIMEDMMSGDPMDIATGVSGEQNYTQTFTNLEIVGERSDEPNLDSYLTGELSRQ